MIRENALWCSQVMGWRVHPVSGLRGEACDCHDGAACTKKPGKHPILPKWQERATTNAKQICGWWDRYPNANLGIATGRVSGIFVFDVDGEAGKASVARLVDEFGDFPDTMMSRTGSGGLHVFFTYPDTEVRNKQALLKGIDIRGEGGFVVGAPSLHVSGERYRWLTPDAPLAQAPDWLLLMMKPKEYAAPAPLVGKVGDVEKASKYLAKIPGAIQGSNGSTQTLKAAIHLVRGFGLSRDEAFALLMSEYNPRCEPVWSEKEMRHKVESAAKSNTVDGYLLRSPVGV